MKKQIDDMFIIEHEDQCITMEIVTNYSKFSGMDYEKFDSYIRKLLPHKYMAEDEYIAKFQAAIQEGPFYICAVCHRLLYKRSVLIVEFMKYERRDVITNQVSFDKKKYICITCHRKLQKKKSLVKP